VDQHALSLVKIIRRFWTWRSDGRLEPWRPNRSSLVPAYVACDQQGQRFLLFTFWILCSIFCIKALALFHH
jgi:hypothetical protein